MIDLLTVTPISFHVPEEVARLKVLVVSELYHDMLVTIWVTRKPKTNRG